MANREIGVDRRAVTLGMGGALLSGVLSAAPVAGAPLPSLAASRKFTIGMIIFDQMTNLDFVGPNQVFGGAPNARTVVIAKSLDPIVTDTGCRVLADTTFAAAPEIDLLFIGGGGGTTKLMEDPEVLNFLRSRAPRAQWITSVCTGTLVLGAAGLLRGYKAATHWTAMEILPLFGAQPVHQRVVFDRNRITGGGVTAGIDFGLEVLARIWGEPLARRTQLILEYAPEPPFDSGSPATATPELVAKVRSDWINITNARRLAAERAVARLS